jgi:hypothetical protein
MWQRVAVFNAGFGAAVIALLAGVVHAQSLTVTDTVPGVFVDVSTSGVALGLTDDGVAEVVPGFDLSYGFFSGGYGRVWVSNNGAIGFVVDGSFGAYYLNAEIPDPGLFGAVHETPQALAVYWDDLDSDTGDVYHATVGEPGARIFVVQWQDRPHYPGDDILDGDESTFQAQIFEDGGPVKAQFLYQDVDFMDPGLDAGASATIGYQAGGVGNDAEWSYNQPAAITAGTVLTLLELPGDCVHAGDANADCHIDLDDLMQLRACLAGPSAPLTPGCECYDVDGNGFVDLADGADFQRAFTGPVDVIPGCVP